MNRPGRGSVAVCRRGADGNDHKEHHKDAIEHTLAESGQITNWCLHA